MGGVARRSEEDTSVPPRTRYRAGPGARGRPGAGAREGRKLRLKLRPGQALVPDRSRSSAARSGRSRARPSRRLSRRESLLPGSSTSSALRGPPSRATDEGSGSLASHAVWFSGLRCSDRAVAWAHSDVASEQLPQDGAPGLDSVVLLLPGCELPGTRRGASMDRVNSQSPGDADASTAGVCGQPVRERREAPE
jgi:hypothetical protein